MARWFDNDLIEAAGNGKIRDVEFLLCSLKADVNAAEETRGDTALIAACKGGQVETVKFLLQREEIDVNKCGRNGKTPLFIACSKTSSEDIFVTKNLEIVSLLLGHPDIDVNTRDKSSTTALMIALRFQSTVYKLLLQHPDINVNLQKEDGNTALMIATRNENIDAVRELLKNYEINIFVENERGESALSISQTKNFTKICELLSPKPMWKETQNVDDTKLDITSSASKRRSPFRVLNGASPVSSPWITKSKSPIPHVFANSTSKVKIQAQKSESEITRFLTEHHFNEIYVEAFHRNGIFKIEDAVQLSMKQLKTLIGDRNFKFSKVDALMNLLKDNLALSPKKRSILYCMPPLKVQYKDDITSAKLHDIIQPVRSSFEDRQVEWIDAGDIDSLGVVLDKMKSAALYLVIASTETYFQRKSGRNYIRIGSLTWAIKHKVPIVVYLLPKYNDHGQVAPNSRFFFTHVKRHFREYMSDSDLDILARQGILQTDVVTAFEALEKISHPTNEDELLRCIEENVTLSVA